MPPTVIAVAVVVALPAQQTPHTACPSTKHRYTLRGTNKQKKMLHFRVCVIFLKDEKISNELSVCSLRIDICVCKILLFVISVVSFLNNTMAL